MKTSIGHGETSHGPESEHGVSLHDRVHNQLLAVLNGTHKV